MYKIIHVIYSHFPLKKIPSFSIVMKKTISSHIFHSILPFIHTKLVFFGNILTAYYSNIKPIVPYCSHIYSIQSSLVEYKMQSNFHWDCILTFFAPDSFCMLMELLCFLETVADLFALVSLICGFGWSGIVFDFD